MGEIRWRRREHKEKEREENVKDAEREKTRLGRKIFIMLITVPSQ